MGLLDGKIVAIGKRYDGGHRLVDRQELQAYAAATDDPNPAYEGDRAVAPPMYHVRAFHDLLLTMAHDPELDLDMLRLVHGEHAMRFHRPLRHGDVLQVRGALAKLEEKASGRVASFGLFGLVDGELALEGSTVFFVRGAKKADGEKKDVAPAPEPPPPDAVIDQRVARDQATRYAAASGDHNPIHLDDAVARSAGLPGVILHGLCTMAFAQRDLIGRYAGGDPTRLAALSVRFARPVFPGQTLRLKVWTDGSGSRERHARVEHLSFVTENDAGQVVITSGRAEVRA